MSDHSDHGFAHPQSITTLLTVFAALVFLTIVTVVQASFHLGNWEIWIALFIASLKAALVLYFFMHLGHEKPFNILVFFSTLFFLALFLGGTLSDRNAYRNQLEPDIDEPYRSEAPAEAAETAAAME
ncbi:cytochrome C oxidase subunit IV family protein [Roseimaritima sediminicola]|uniref:cytochrome C oxidase subunit IV family protein n=1 Tax=Roseimaritima sediminicola TaxID=2662066 RepID=UPI00129827D1|nr:cytochrome C oxidase subunit IV family protein [Roseimaritima sediminicola]